MNRRKFLYSGSFGFLTFNSAFSFVDSLLGNRETTTVFQFLEWLQADKKVLSSEHLQNIMAQNNLKSYLSLGYKADSNVYFSSENYTFFSLKLTDSVSVVDEVVLIFKEGKEMVFCGSFNSRHINLFFQKKSDLEELAKKYEVSISDLIVPENSKRWMEGDKIFYSSYFNQIGFKSSVENNIFDTEFVLKNKVGDIEFEGNVISEHYPLKNSFFHII
jgi:hypothetical protein